MRTTKRITLATLAATCWLAAAAPGIATAQAPIPAPVPAATPATVFDAAAKQQAIAAAAKLLTDDYVYADIGARAAAMLTANLAAGTYDAVATPGDFAARVTRDLQDLTHDKHLHVEADGVRPEGLPPGPPPVIGFHGFAQADRLKGNIGYIVLNGFAPKDHAKLGADKAMTLLASTDALIIDIRHNGGGDPAGVAYLVSIFFDGKTPVHINDLLWRTPGTTDYDRTVYTTEPTTISYLGKPVYVITGRDTFSAGEEFAYDMQTLKRATLIGEVTAGGAHPGGLQAIGPGLNLWVPMGRAENPVTHTDWEGTGVQPDIVVSPDQSFATAYAAALHILGRSVPTSVDSPEAVTDAHLLVLPGS